MSFRRRVFSIFAAISIIQILIIAIVFNFYTFKLKNESTERYFNETLNNISTQLDTIILNMDIVSSQVLANEQVQESFKNAAAYNGEINYFDENIEERNLVQGALWAFNSPKRTIQSINIFTDYSFIGLRASPSNSLIKYVSELEKWYDIEEYYKILPPHIDDWNENNESKKVVSLVRPLILTLSTFEVIATIEVQEDYKYIERICSNEDATRHTLVFESSGVPVFIPDGFSDESILSIFESAENQKTDKLYTVKNESGTFVASYRKLENTDWTVILFQEKESYTAETKSLLVLLISIGVVLILAAVGVVFLTTKTVTKPIEKLRVMVSNVSLTQNVIEGQPVSDLNEIQMLQNTFYNMVEQIRNSANLLIQAQEAELMFKISELQSKINPHFLYNSLMAIGAAGQEEGSEKVETMCFLLSELFRYSSTDTSIIATLDEEVKHIENYLSFMKMRYEDNLNIEFESKGDLRKVKLSRQSLQPIVENSFIHGFYQVKPPYNLKFSCIVEDSMWNITVTDNGGGIKKDRLETILNKVQSIDEIILKSRDAALLKTDEMALINIYIRLKLEYKNALTFIIKNNESREGVTIKISAPIPEDSI